MEKLTKETFLFYAARNYQNPHCTSIGDFDEDCKKFVQARTLMRNYYKRGRVRIRLLLNHVIVCTNMFGNQAAVDLFFYYCEEELHGCLVAIFDFLNILPEELNHIKPDPNIEHMIKIEEADNSGTNHHANSN
jgi:hypothetical protein